MWGRHLKTFCVSTKSCVILYYPMDCDFPGGAGGKASAYSMGDLGPIPWVRKISWRREWQLTPVSLGARLAQSVEHGMLNPRFAGSSPTLGACSVWASLVAQRLKHLPVMRETWVQSLGWEDPLEKEMAIHSSILAWRIPWTKEPGGLQSTGSQKVGQDWVTSLSLWTEAHQAPLSMGFSRQECWIGCHAVLQGIFLTQGANPHLLCLLCWQKGSLPLAPPGKPENILDWVSEVTQSCPTLCDPMDCRLPGFSVHGILQARTLEWAAITSSKLLISYCENICTFFKRLMSLEFEMLLLSQYIHKHMNTFGFKQLIDNVEGF